MFFIVRLRLQELARLESERQRQLEEREAAAAIVRQQLAQLSTGMSTASFPAMNVHEYPGGSDIGATGVHGFGSMSEPDEWHG